MILYSDWFSDFPTTIVSLVSYNNSIIQILVFRNFEYNKFIGQVRDIA